MKVGVAAVLVLLGTFAGLTVAGVTPASASTLDGLATLANPSTNGPVDSGGSATDFTVALAPSGTVPAACDGDTASDGYHVFSYLVPQGTSPTSESFTTGFPSIDYGLVTDAGQYYGKVNTGIGTGQVLSPPNNLQFAELLSKGVTLDDPALQRQQHQRDLGGGYRLCQYERGGDRLLERPGHLHRQRI